MECKSRILQLYGMVFGYVLINAEKRENFSHEKIFREINVVSSFIVKRCFHEIFVK